MTTATATEARLEFACFGSRAAAQLSGADGADQALDEVRRYLEGWHRRFSRFDAGSELSRLNANPDRRVRASDAMCRFVAAALDAAARTGGLVDPTLACEIEAAGYDRDLGDPVPLAESLRSAPPRRRAHPHPRARWRDVEVDRCARTVIRPPGTGLDSGGIAKGLAADITGERLRGHDAFAIDCGGDLLVGGQAGRPRPVRVDDPFGRGVLHEFDVVAAGVATSGIGRRSWLDPRGRVAHHLLDPSTGSPAFTGIVQATALAPTALGAEALAKAALLSGPRRAPAWLRHGGVLVFDDGSCEVFDPCGIDAR